MARPVVAYGCRQIDLFSGPWTSESAANFVLDEAKNAGDAVASARLFNEVQDKICRLQPFDGPLNKSNKVSCIPK